MVPVTASGSVLHHAVPEPGSRLVRNVWIGYLVGLTTLALYAVSVPVLAVAYGVPVGLAFLVTAGHVGAVPLALARPQHAATLSASALLVTGLLVGAGDGPWPVPVPALVTQLVVCVGVGVRGGPAASVAGLALAVGAAAAPVALASVGQGAVPGATGNLVTFGSLAVLVTTLTLVTVRVSRGAGASS